MEPREYLKLFRRRWWLIASIALLGATFAWLTAPANVAPKVQRFRAEHTLIVESEARQFTPENPETIALLASSGEVPNRVAARLGVSEDDAQRLLGRVEVVGDANLGIVKFTATTDTPAEAQAVADTFAQELVTFLDEQEASARTRQIDSIRTQIDELRTQIQIVSDDIADGSGDPAVLEEQRLVLVSQFGDAESTYRSLLAEPPASSGLRSLGPSFAVQIDAGIQPPRGRSERAMILGVLGLLLGLAVVVLLERLDVRIKTKEEAEAAFRIPVIAEIPALPIARRRTRSVFSHIEPASAVAEAYRGLRTTLLILKPRPITPNGPGLDTMRRRATDVFEPPPEVPAAQPQVFLVTSTRPSEGKTTTSVNLAAAFAEAGRSVIIIAADIRRPEAHLYVGVPRAPGLTEALRGVAPHLESLIVPTSIPGVRILPSGSHVSNPGELLLQGPDIIDEVRSMADIVIVDTTPMLTVNDAVQLMPSTDAVIIACRAGRGNSEAAKRAQEILARLRTPVAGIVLVGARETPGTSSYYYGYQATSSGGPLARLRRQARNAVFRPTAEEPSVEDPPTVLGELPSAGASTEGRPEPGTPVRRANDQLGATRERFASSRPSATRTEDRTDPVVPHGSPSTRPPDPDDTASDPWAWP